MTPDVVTHRERIEEDCKSSSSRRQTKACLSRVILESTAGFEALDT
jgi:hypothetical protein